MTKQLAFSGGLFWATGAAAHPGTHLHPHDGASWLSVVLALGMIALAGGMALARARSRK